MKISVTFVAAVLAIAASATPHRFQRHNHVVRAVTVKPEPEVDVTTKTVGSSTIQSIVSPKPVTMVGDFGGSTLGPHTQLDPVTEAEDTKATKTFASSVATNTKEAATIVNVVPSAINKRTDRHAVEPEAPSPAHTIEINPHLQKRAAVTVSNIFVPIATAKPPSQISARSSHPVKPIGITDSDVPLQTNKFYSNLFLGTRDRPVYAMPYTLWWSRGVTESPSDGFWGMSVSHTDEEQKGFGPDLPTTGENAPEYYYSPVWQRSLSFSATELYGTATGGKASMDVDTLRQFSVGVTIHQNKGVVANNIRFIICQGMGLVSAQYTNLTPRFDSSWSIKSLTLAPSPRADIVKYKVVITNVQTENWDGNWVDVPRDKLWVIYAKATGTTPFVLTLVNQNKIEASSPFTGLIQIAKVAKTELNAAAEAALDASAGAACQGVTVTGSVSGTSGTYKLNFAKQTGVSQKLLMYSYVHHRSSFDTTTRNALQAGVQLSSNTKGTMQAVLADSWTMVETNLQTNLAWFPTSRTGGSAVFSAAKMAQLVTIIKQEAVEDIKNQTSLPELYYNAKAYAKFAQVCLVAKDIVKDATISKACLTSLKAQWDKYAKNTWKNKLIYDWIWRGVVTVTAWDDPDPYADFGAGRYNDHHFQYSYFVYAGALIAYLDKALYGNSNWLNANKDFINTLARDYSNPSASDVYFPEMRSFSYFDGHSWATGVFEDKEGKNEESSSEDVFAQYALKMWGSISGNAALEGLATLNLSILKRSLNEYMILTPGVSSAHPDLFNKNRVSGILWENKAAHQTWFGNEIHKIQGIHMIPFNPASTFIKSAAWAQNEWQLYFEGKTSKINDGWKGVLYNNKCLWDPASTWAFFVQNGYNKDWTDQGASRSWYLAVAGMMGGAAT